MNKLLGRAVIIVMLFLTFKAGGAVAGEGRHIFSLGLGMADGVGTSENEAGLGSATYLGYSYQWHRNYQAGIDLTNANFANRQSAVNATTEMEAAALQGYLRINFNPSSPYITYGSAGVGPVFVNKTDNTGSASIADQTTAGCYSLALGIDHPFDENWILGVEGRYIESWSRLLQGAAIIAKLSFSL